LNEQTVANSSRLAAQAVGVPTRLGSVSKLFGVQFQAAGSRPRIQAEMQIVLLFILLLVPELHLCLSCTKSFACR